MLDPDRSGVINPGNWVALVLHGNAIAKQRHPTGSGRARRLTGPFGELRANADYRLALFDDPRGTLWASGLVSLTAGMIAWWRLGGYSGVRIRAASGGRSRRSVAGNPRWGRGSATAKSEPRDAPP